MAKYDQLTEYLRRETMSEVTLSFFRIELMIGGALPRSAGEAGWWRTSTSTLAEAPKRTHQQAWLSVGFDAQLQQGGRVRFSRKS